jgi:hypothetical protein
MRRILLKEGGLFGTVPSGFRSIGIYETEFSINNGLTLSSVDTYLTDVNLSGTDLVFTSLQPGYSGTVSLSPLFGSLNTTGITISFTSSQIYNSPDSPGTSSITEDLTGAKIGIVQKIYHNDSVVPTFPDGWVRLGAKTYQISTLNIIFAEWVGGTASEYWITQRE